MLCCSHGPKFTLGLELTPPGILVAGGIVGTRQQKTELGFGSMLPILLQWCLCGVAVWDLPWPLHSHEVS